MPQKEVHVGVIFYIHLYNLVFLDVLRDDDTFTMLSTAYKHAIVMMKKALEVVRWLVNKRCCSCSNSSLPSRSTLARK